MKSFLFHLFVLALLSPIGILPYTYAEEIIKVLTVLSIILGIYLLNKDFNPERGEIQ